MFPLNKSLSSAHTANLVLGQDNGVQIHIDGETIRLGSADAHEALAIASKVEAELEKIRSAFQSHVHTYHNTPTTTQIAPVNDIATKKVVAS